MIANITTATLHDLRALHRLERICFGPDAWGYLELMLVLLTPGNVRLKLQHEEQVVGFVVGESRPHKGFAQIGTLAVHPSFHRRGLGSRLLAACESHLSQPIIRLTVRVSNTPAIRLYEKFGYRRRSIWPKYYVDGEDGLNMEKTWDER